MINVLSPSGGNSVFAYRDRSYGEIQIEFIRKFRIDMQYYRKIKKGVDNIWQKNLMM
jgi:hypothetical protein